MSLWLNWRPLNPIIPRIALHPEEFLAEEAVNVVSLLGVSASTILVPQPAGFLQPPDETVHHLVEGVRVCEGQERATRTSTTGQNTQPCETR